MVVGEGSLRFHIASLRKALGERAQGGAYLTTVTGRGYCFTAKRALSGLPATTAIVRPFEGTRLPAALRGMIGIENSTADAAAEQAFESLLAVLRDKHMLPIFDGREQLVDAVAELAERLFRR